jgi:hypothetical protein
LDKLVLLGIEISDILTVYLEHGYLDRVRNSLQQLLFLFFVLEDIHSQLLWSDRGLTFIKIVNMLVRIKLVFEFKGCISFDILFERDD